MSWPGIEPVARNDVINRHLLHSAAEQPFQGGFGIDEFYPTIHAKAACLFFSIAGNHIFGNGNKRTAVLSLDQFLVANSTYLLLSNQQVYDLAVETARYNERKQSSEEMMAKIERLVRENSIECSQLLPAHLELYERSQRARRIIRRINVAMLRRRRSANVYGC